MADKEVKTEDELKASVTATAAAPLLVAGAPFAALGAAGYGAYKLFKSGAQKLTKEEINQIKTLFKQKQKGQPRKQYRTRKVKDAPGKPLDPKHGTDIFVGGTTKAPFYSYEEGSKIDTPPLPAVTRVYDKESGRWIEIPTEAGYGQPGEQVIYKGVRQPETQKGGPLSVFVAHKPGDVDLLTFDKGNRQNTSNPAQMVGNNYLDLAKNLNRKFDRIPSKMNFMQFVSERLADFTPLVTGHFDKEGARRFIDNRQESNWIEGVFPTRKKLRLRKKRKIEKPDIPKDLAVSPYGQPRINLKERVEERWQRERDEYSVSRGEELGRPVVLIFKTGLLDAGDRGSRPMTFEERHLYGLEEFDDGRKQSPFWAKRHELVDELNKEKNVLMGRLEGYIKQLQNGQAAALDKIESVQREIVALSAKEKYRLIFFTEEEGRLSDEFNSLDPSKLNGWLKKHTKFLDRSMPWGTVPRQGQSLEWSMKNGEWDRIRIPVNMFTQEQWKEKVDRAIKGRLDNVKVPWNPAGDRRKLKIGEATSRLMYGRTDRPFLPTSDFTESEAARALATGNTLPASELRPLFDKYQQRLKEVLTDENIVNRAKMLYLAERDWRSRVTHHPMAVGEKELPLKPPSAHVTKKQYGSYLEKAKQALAWDVWKDFTRHEKEWKPAEDLRKIGIDPSTLKSASMVPDFSERATTAWKWLVGTIEPKNTWFDVPWTEGRWGVGNPFKADDSVVHGAANLLGSLFKGIYQGVVATPMGWDSEGKAESVDIPVWALRHDALDSRATSVINLLRGDDPESSFRGLFGLRWKVRKSWDPSANNGKGAWKGGWVAADSWTASDYRDKDDKELEVISKYDDMDAVEVAAHVAENLPIELTALAMFFPTIAAGMWDILAEPFSGRNANESAEVLKQKMNHFSVGMVESLAKHMGDPKAGLVDEGAITQFLWLLPFGQLSAGMMRSLLRTRLGQYAQNKLLTPETYGYKKESMPYSEYDMPHSPTIPRRDLVLDKTSGKLVPWEKAVDDLVEQAKKKAIDETGSPLTPAAELEARQAYSLKTKTLYGECVRILFKKTQALDKTRKYLEKFRKIILEEAELANAGKQGKLTPEQFQRTARKYWAMQSAQTRLEIATEVAKQTLKSHATNVPNPYLPLLPRTVGVVLNYLPRITQQLTVMGMPGVGYNPLSVFETVGLFVDWALAMEGRGMLAAYLSKPSELLPAAFAQKQAELAWSVRRFDTTVRATAEAIPREHRQKVGDTLDGGGKAGTVGRDDLVTPAAREGSAMEALDKVRDSQARRVLKNNEKLGIDELSTGSEPHMMTARVFREEYLDVLSKPKHQGTPGHKRYSEIHIEIKSSQKKRLEDQYGNREMAIHFLHVKKAVYGGKKVPLRVLQEYPDLLRAYKRKHNMKPNTPILTPEMLTKRKGKFVPGDGKEARSRLYSMYEERLPLVVWNPTKQLVVETGANKATTLGAWEANPILKNQLKDPMKWSQAEANAAFMNMWGRDLSIVALEVSHGMKNIRFWNPLKDNGPSRAPGGWQHGMFENQAALNKFWWPQQYKSWGRLTHFLNRELQKHWGRETLGPRWSEVMKNMVDDLGGPGAKPAPGELGASTSALKMSEMRKRGYPLEALKKVGLEQNLVKRAVTGLAGANFAYQSFKLYKHMADDASIVFKGEGQPPLVKGFVSEFVDEVVVGVNQRGPWIKMSEETMFKGSNTPRYGPLAGRWVHESVYWHLKYAEELAYVAQHNRWSQHVSTWKALHTVWNMPTLMRNMYTNVLLYAPMNDMMMMGKNMNYYRRAFREMKEGGDLYKLAYEYGAFDGTFARTELSTQATTAVLKGFVGRKKITGVELQELARKLAKQDFDGLSDKAKFFLQETPGSLYSAMDDYFRFSHWLKLTGLDDTVRFFRKKGMDEGAAIRKAIEGADKSLLQEMANKVRKDWIDYENSPYFVNILRTPTEMGLGIKNMLFALAGKPFFSFSALNMHKSGPIRRWMTQNPIKYQIYKNVWDTLSAYEYADALGSDPDTAKRWMKAQRNRMPFWRRLRYIPMTSTGIIGRAIEHLSGVPNVKGERVVRDNVIEVPSDQWGDLPKDSFVSQLNIDGIPTGIKKPVKTLDEAIDVASTLIKRSSHTAQNRAAVAAIIQRDLDIPISWDSDINMWVARQKVTNETIIPMVTRWFNAGYYTPFDWLVPQLEAYNKQNPIGSFIAQLVANQNPLTSLAIAWSTEKDPHFKSDLYRDDPNASSWQNYGTRMMTFWKYGWANMVPPWLGGSSYDKLKSIGNQDVRGRVRGAMETWFDALLGIKYESNIELPDDISRQLTLFDKDMGKAEMTAMDFTRKQFDDTKVSPQAEGVVLPQKLDLNRLIDYANGDDVHRPKEGEPITPRLAKDMIDFYMKTKARLGLKALERLIAAVGTVPPLPREWQAEEGPVLERGKTDKEIKPPTVEVPLETWGWTGDTRKNRELLSIAALQMMITGLPMGFYNNILNRESSFNQEEFNSYLQKRVMGANDGRKLTRKELIKISNMYKEKTKGYKLVYEMLFGALDERGTVEQDPKGIISNLRTLKTRLKDYIDEQKKARQHGEPIPGKEKPGYYEHREVK